MSPLHSLVTSSDLGPNIFLTTPFSKALSLHYTVNMKDQVQHPSKTRKKIIVLYILTSFKRELIHHNDSH